jgi:hypothetical protein
MGNGDFPVGLAIIIAAGVLGAFFLVALTVGLFLLAAF